MLTFKSLFRKSVFLLFCLYHITPLAVCQPFFCYFEKYFCRLASFLYRNEFVRLSSSWKICSVVFSSFLIWNKPNNQFLILFISTYLLGISLLFICLYYIRYRQICQHKVCKNLKNFCWWCCYAYIRIL